MRLRSVLFWLLLLLLLGGAGLLTVARLLQPVGGVWIRLVSFTPLAIGGYAALTLLLLARLARPGTGRRRWPWLAMSVLVAAPLGLHLWWVSPQFTGANPPPAPDATTLSVLTANALRGRIDALGLVEAASAADADIMVIEEMTPAALATMESGGLAEGWPYRAGTVGPSTHGTMVFSRFELGTAEPIATIFQSWSVPVSTPDGELQLLAVHPYPPVDPAQWRADHAAIRAAAERADLIVGDLNATPDHAPLRALNRDGFRTVSELTNAGWQPTWPVNGLFRVVGIPLPAAVQIDHVLIGPRLAAISNRTVQVVGTDHAVVLAEVAFQ